MTDPARDRYMLQVYQQMLDDLSYPVAKNGDVMDVSALKPTLARHLVRLGWRKPNNVDGLALREEFDDPLIKKRPIGGPGVMEDAVMWVSADEPDDPLADLPNMTVAQINALPEQLQIEAKRRLGLIPPSPITDPTPAWSVKPYITITPDEDPHDGTRWA